MPEHELWLTAWFNEHLAGLANAILGIFNLQAKDPSHPWENWIVCELVVVAFLMVTAAVVRSGLSPDKPGKLQMAFEWIYGFVRDTAVQAGIYHPEPYVPYFATVGLFILSMNLIGIIPAFEAPTMSPWVPAGMAISTFVYYNAFGIQAQGLGRHLAHFAGPVRFGSAIANFFIMLLMVPIELISHLARPLSLTVRLYGNMFGGEQVTNVFLRLTYLVLPAAFMGLHVFVAVVQTYVFMLLTMIYVGLATTAHDH
jgi:F-type H+-transporting ATPase subunit a